jgi:hypothetical protein
LRESVNGSGKRFGGGLSPEHRKYRVWGCTYLLRYRDHAACNHLLRYPRDISGLVSEKPNRQL